MSDQPDSKRLTRQQRRLLMQQLLNEAMAEALSNPPPNQDNMSSSESDSDYEPSQSINEDDDATDDEYDEDEAGYDAEEDEEDEEDEGIYDLTEEAAAFAPIMHLLSPGMRENAQPFMLCIQAPALLPPPPPPPRDNDNDEPGNRSRKRARNDESEFVRHFTTDEKEYWKKLNEEKKSQYLEVHKHLRNIDTSAAVPIRFKFLGAEMEPSNKALILAKLDQFQMMHEGSGEYFKLRNWLNAAGRIPFGKYFPLPVQPTDPTDKVCGFLNDVQKTLDAKVYGHLETKNQIMRILAQWISNPGSKGHCIGIQGYPGTGKTVLIKEGVCKALGLPFGFVALGGASDGSFLEGHSFTYEGSTYGKISEILMKTQCMNPILFFDELDKVSGTRRGDEIIGILTHLTDSSQNERYQDKYFGELDLNLSKCLTVFSYNDESLINPILKDRMITIHVKGYTVNDKLKIATEYLIPDLLQQYNIGKDDVVFPTDIIQYIISRVNEEEGVRNLKRGLEAVLSWINMHKYLPPDSAEPIAFPLIINEDHVKKYLRPDDGSARIKEDVMRMMYL